MSAADARGPLVDLKLTPFGITILNGVNVHNVQQLSDYADGHFKKQFDTDATLVADKADSNMPPGFGKKIIDYLGNDPNTPDALMRSRQSASPENIHTFEAAILELAKDFKHCVAKLNNVPELCAENEQNYNLNAEDSRRWCEYHQCTRDKYRQLRVDDYEPAKDDSTVVVLKQHNVYVPGWAKLFTHLFSAAGNYQQKVSAAMLGKLFFLMQESYAGSKILPCLFELPQQGRATQIERIHAEIVAPALNAQQDYVTALLQDHESWKGLSQDELFEQHLKYDKNYMKLYGKAMAYEVLYQALTNEEMHCHPLPFDRIALPGPDLVPTANLAELRAAKKAKMDAKLTAGSPKVPKAPSVPSDVNDTD